MMTPREVEGGEAAGYVQVRQEQLSRGDSGHLVSQWNTLIARASSRYCALIGWDHGVALSFASKTQLKAPKAPY